MSEMVARQAGAGPTVFDPEACELNDSERLLVWAMRKYAFRCATACLVEHEFRNTCGDLDGRVASAAFRQMLRLLARHGRRPLALGPPGWPGATPDEHRLLQLLAAAQARSKDRVRMYLAWFLPTGAARQVRPFVEFVAKTLCDHHCLLPLAIPLAPPAREVGPFDLNGSMRTA